MSKIQRKTENRIWAKLRSTHGMTLAELLIVVGIVIVLSGVAFIAVFNHQRSMAQLERDGIAKEIYIAAQNHLTVALGQGYLQTTDYGESGVLDGVYTEDDGVYYFVVNDGTVSPDVQDIYELMLPFGSIDETVRSGGSYMICYQPDSGTVLDVFYCSTHGSTQQAFNHNLSTGSEYATVMGLTENKAGRKNYTDGAVLGYYGGADTATLAEIHLQAPSIEVINEDKLAISVTDAESNFQYTGQYSLKLIMTGELSHAQKSFTLLTTDTTLETVESDRMDRTITAEADEPYLIILDDITQAGKHFCEIQGEVPAMSPIAFIPGENITVQAVAYSIKTFANVAFSPTKTTNSLFADGSSASVAQIKYIRHLENLDSDISSLGNHDDPMSKKLSIGSAVQTGDMDWATFYDSTPSVIYGVDADESAAFTSEAGFYYPVEPKTALTYNGKGHSISNIQVDSAKIVSDYARDDAGLFGTSSNLTSISDLELIDFDITGTDTAGTLAGSLTSSTVSNVLARHTNDNTTADITSQNGTGGGLVGVQSGGSIRNSAAAVRVTASVAGGLVGTANSTISGCYSGGHTSYGEYYEHTDKDTRRQQTLNGKQSDVPIYNIVGSETAGGLVGNATGATISNSYSTCSVSGATSGGFVGSANGQITNSYCTGLVSGDHAFIGSGSLAGGSTGNQYYKIINKEVVTDAQGTHVKYKEPGSDAVTAIDDSLTSWDTFVGGVEDWTPAKPYDNSLVSYYNGLYNLKIVDELGADVQSTDFVYTHYGDWPVPEIMTNNTERT